MAVVPTVKASGRQTNSEGAGASEETARRFIAGDRSQERLFLFSLVLVCLFVPRLLEQSLRSGFDARLQSITS